MLNVLFLFISVINIAPNMYVLPGFTAKPRIKLDLKKFYFITRKAFNVGVERCIFLYTCSCDIPRQTHLLAASPDTDAQAVAEMHTQFPQCIHAHAAQHVVPFMFPADPNLAHAAGFSIFSGAGDETDQAVINSICIQKAPVEDVVSIYVKPVRAGVSAWGVCGHIYDKTTQAAVIGRCYTCSRNTNKKCAHVNILRSWVYDENSIDNETLRSFKADFQKPPVIRKIYTRKPKSSC
jgi:hypothetical protein